MVSIDNTTSSVYGALVGYAKTTRATVGLRLAGNSKLGSTPTESRFEIRDFFFFFILNGHRSPTIYLTPSATDMVQSLGRRRNYVSKFQVIGEPDCDSNYVFILDC